ncbi:G-protein coupled receptor GRL101-like [Procambarus clarkii]|uniref:G-protein coupled receptor GRL101-like n=1 Tax=Procambarus clarkii TaxID=6728 RepID=UPI001E6761D6|nr:G-protein coupled receptor GRL101-like [Procambarus clarkii]
MCRAGQLRCGSGPCLSVDRACDGYIDCPLTWDDEDNCPFACAASTPSCECRDITISCERRGLTLLPQDIELQISRFRLSGNFFNHTLTPASFTRYPHVVFLDLSNNSLTSLPAGMFLSLSRLRILDLRDNLLSALRNSTFLGLASLRTLHLTGNKLVAIEGWSLYGLSSLSAL